MKKEIVGLIAVVVVVAVVAGAYVITLPPSTPTTKLKAAMVMHAPINDYNWGAAGWEGMQALRDELGFAIVYSEKVSVADFELSLIHI